MIYPENVGPAGDELHLKTLDSIWLVGKLKMWGRWSRISSNSSVKGVFARLLAKDKISKTALNAAIKKLNQAGISKEELFQYFGNLDQQKTHSSLTHCTDSEGLLIDGVIGSALFDTPGLIAIVRDRYVKGLSKKEMAEDLQMAFPNLSLRTCQRRIDTWLAASEIILFTAMTEAFEKRIEQNDKKPLTI